MLKIDSNGKRERLIKQAQGYIPHTFPSANKIKTTLSAMTQKMGYCVIKTLDICIIAKAISKYK